MAALFLEFLLFRQLPFFGKFVPSFRLLKNREGFRRSGLVFVLLLLVLAVLVLRSSPAPVLVQFPFDALRKLATSLRNGAVRTGTFLQAFLLPTLDFFALIVLFGPALIVGGDALGKE